MILLTICIGILISQCSAQLVRSEPCPPYNPISDFDFEKISGSWYEWARVDNVYESGQICGKMHFFKDNSGNFRERVTSIVSLTGGHFKWEGQLVPLNGTSGAFKLLFPKYAGQKEVVGAFIATDWDHWMITTGCQELNGATLQYVFILTRTLRLSKQHENEIDRALEENNIALDKIVSVDHQRCPAE